MAWSFLQSWTTGYSLSSTDSSDIQTDFRTAGGNRDGGHYGQPNNAFITLPPGELPGDSYTVTAASWTSGVANITIGANNFQVNQHFSLSGASPSAWNGSDYVVTATGGSGAGANISFALASNPGTWTSGGTVIAAGVSAASGMVATDQNINLAFHDGANWRNVWTNLSYSNGWGNFPGYQVGQYLLDAFGFVHLRGNLTSGTQTDATTIFTLPAGFRPPSTIGLQLNQYLGGGTITANSMLFIQTSGVVEVYGVGGVTSTALYILHHNFGTF